LKKIGVPVFVIGFGASAVATASTGMCIAQNSGAILPDGSVGYFPVSSADGLTQAFEDIFSIVNETSKDFASATVSSVQAGAEQMVYLATFNAAKNRSVWNGRVNGYRLDPQGSLKLGSKTITDPNDPNKGQTLSVPSNDPSSLIWNAGRTWPRRPAPERRAPAAFWLREPLCSREAISTRRTTPSRRSRPISTRGARSSSLFRRAPRAR
jgi:hypothetical protein